MAFATFGWSLLLTTFAGAGVLPSMPLDDPATLLLERLEGTAGCVLPVQRPWPGEQVLACVDSLLVAPDVTIADKSRLGSLRRRIDLRDTTTQGGLVSWSEGADRLSFDVGARLYAHSIDRSVAIGPTLYDSLDQDRLVGLRVRPRVDVLLGPDLAIWARPIQIVEMSDQRRWVKMGNPAQGVYQTALFAQTGEMGKARTSDWIEGAIEFESPLGRFAGGLTSLEWGDLPIEPLMLSGRTESFLNLRTTKRIGPIEATVLGARLIGDTWSERRYLYAHRFAFNGKSVRFGWSEMILSIDRDLEPLYLIPVFPYVFTEHYLGDPDNKQMDFDASWRISPRLELSAELFLDDLQNYLGFLSDGWGNKWALGIGLKAAGWTGPGSLDRFQVTRIEPWTGTPSSSIVPGAASNAPIHFGKTLGSEAGPNSARLAWIHTQDLSERWTWSAEVSALWKGTDPGSSILDRNWRDSSGTWVVAQPLKKWLDGDLIDRQEWAIGLQWRCTDAWRIDAAAGLARESVPTRAIAWRPAVSLSASYRE